MPDKMTDNEIVRVLDLLHKRILKDKFASRVSEGEILALVEVKHLINRLQAENERLTADSKRLKKVQMQLDDMCKMYHIIKAEAYKEFAKFLIDKSKNGITYNSDIPGLVKTKVGDIDAL